MSALERPLEGLTVVVTRSEESSAELIQLLEAAGATALAIPAIRHETVPHPAGLREALAGGAPTHVVVTSPAAARHLSRALEEEGIRLDARARVAAVGPATTAALQAAGLPPRIVSGGKSGRDLARDLVGTGDVNRGSRVLLPRSDIALRDIEEVLSAAGAEVIPVVLYRTVTESAEKARPFLDLMERGTPPFAVTFTSPSTFRGFLEMTGEEGLRALAGGGMKCVSIGATTTMAIRHEGLAPAAEAAKPSAEALVEAVVSLREERA